MTQAHGVTHLEPVIGYGLKSTRTKHDGINDCTDANAPVQSLKRSKERLNTFYMLPASKVEASSAMSAMRAA